MSLLISSLLADYRAGQRTPSSVIASLLARDDGEYACAWISRSTPAILQRRAAELDALLRADPNVIARMPLFGVPFAAKDNIDVAGLPTTVGCPAYSYVPQRSATVIERLEAAGAIVLGKTNLDQFATGLVGTRSPYGAVPNSFRPEYISGGSSSGSAVVVARGGASFSLGTDTAGSGRVPAGLNNIVGLKPSKGLISTRGVVPACQSLDCVSVFALDVPDALAVFDVARGYDDADPYSRTLPLYPAAAGATFRAATPSNPEFFGDEHARRGFEHALGLLGTIGAQTSSIDFSLFLDVAALLYEGPWVAERMAAIRPFFEQHASEMHPVVREIIGGAGKFSATDLFQQTTRLQQFKKQAAATWQQTDVIVVPTSPTTYTIADVLADPIATNRRMGLYTNFVNLLDMAALAVPTSIRADGLPCGVTLIGPAGSDRMLAALGQRLHQASALKLGALDAALPPAATIDSGADTVRVAVVGAHLQGLPLNHELTQRGARLERAGRTAPRYRLFALPGTVPPKPGLSREPGNGHAIELEIWQLPTHAYGSFVAGIPSPLGIGRIELEDGSWVQGFVCESWALAGAQDISSLGGWRAYLSTLSKR